ncbi:efflux RND transporter periplasmic adaptor subunit [Pedobacter sp. PWIIR3]
MKAFNLQNPGIILFVAASVFILSCGQPADQSADSPLETTTPVEVATVDTASLSEYTELTAVSSYLQKSYIKASINGYIQSASAQVGQQVRAGQILFRLITKEARAIGDGVNELDPSLKFSGQTSIRADQSGFVTSVSHQKGDYVQDGEAMAVVTTQNSLVFLLNLPYELNGLTKTNHTVELTLPDGVQLKGTLGEAFAGVDSAAQTKRLIIKVNPASVIPEGLVAKVRMRNTYRSATQTLPKSAVLANETEDEFWVMKLINDTTAVKVLVKPGITTSKKIEVLSPKFNTKDRFITVGNYGIADTAKVKIIKQDGHE